MGYLNSDATLLLQTVADIAQTLIRTDRDHFRQEAEFALRLLSERAQFSGLYLWQASHSAHKPCYQLLCGEGKPLQQELYTLPAADIPQLEALLLETWVFQGNPSALQGELRPLMRQGDSVSALFVPIMVDEQLLGFLSAETSQLNYSFSAEQLCVLRSVSGLLAAPLLQRFETPPERAQDCARTKTMLMANLSHELRTPLHAILSSASALQRDLTPADTAAEQITQAARSLLCTLENILEISALELGELTLRQAPLSLAAVVEAACDANQSSIREKGQQLQLDIPALPSLLGDAPRLTQVISQLLGNASKHTPPGSHICISATAQAAQDHTCRVTLSVSDDGPGMDESTSRQLFTPFQQGDNSLTRGQAGLGLGLSIAKGLAEKMGGTLSLTTTGDKGSTFTVFLPFSLAQSAETDTNTIPLSPPQLGGRRALLVDDNALNRMVLLPLLEECGLETSEAVDGFSALAQLAAEAEAPAVIFMDIHMHMPGMDGYETTQRIRTLKQPDCSAVPIIAVTANSFEADIQRCLAAGMDAHLAKPIDLPQLWRVLQEIPPANLTQI